MRKRFLVTENEKKEILGLYNLLSEALLCNRKVETTPEKIGLNNLVSEDVTKIMEGVSYEWAKQNKKNLQTCEKAKVPLKETCRQNTRYRSQTNSEEPMLQNIVNASILDSKMRSTFGRLKQSYNRDKGNIDNIAAMITYNNLLRDFLNTWNSEESGNKDVVLEVNFQKVELPEEPPQEINGGGASNIELQPFNPTGNLYVDNLFDVTEDYKNQFKTQVISLINEAKTSVPGIQLFLKSVYVETSASRFRNTGDNASKWSFLQLSQGRNNATATYILNELKNAGVLNTDKITVQQDFKAERSERNPNGNGDGSSGPNPPEGYNFVPVGDVPMSTQGTNRNEAGTPLKTKEEYEKFKFNRAYIVLEAKIPPNTTTQPTPENPEISEVFNYDIKVGEKSRRRRDFPSLPQRYPKPKFAPGPKKDIINNLMLKIFKPIKPNCGAYD